MEESIRKNRSKNRFIGDKDEIVILKESDMATAIEGVFSRFRDCYTSNGWDNVDGVTRTGGACRDQEEGVVGGNGEPLNNADGIDSCNVKNYSDDAGHAKNLNVINGEGEAYNRDKVGYGDKAGASFGDAKKGDTTLPHELELLYKLEFAGEDLSGVLRGVLIEMEKCEQLRLAWDMAAYFFKCSSHEAFKMHGIQPAYHIALIVYVLDYPQEPNQFYRKFNKCTREIKTDSDIENFPYKHYFKLLRVAVLKTHGVYQSSKSSAIDYLPDPAHLVLFIGIRGDPDVQVKQTLCFRQFISTSTNMETAQGFAGTENGTVFVIEGLLPLFKCSHFPKRIHGFINAVGLDHISELVGLGKENETLIWPYELFTVKEIKVVENVKYIYLRGKNILTTKLLSSFCVINPIIARSATEIVSIEGETHPSCNVSNLFTKEISEHEFPMVVPNNPAMEGKTYKYVFMDPVTQFAVMNRLKKPIW